MIAICRAALVVFLLLAGMESGLTLATPAESPLGTFLAGVVVDEQGAPVAGAEIEIAPYRPGYGVAISEAITASSGKDGAFRIEGLEPGTLYRMITWKHGLVPREDAHLDPSAGLSAVGGSSRLVLRRGRTATGRIVDAAGRPVAGATLDLSQTSGHINWLHPGRSRRRGPGDPPPERCDAVRPRGRSVRRADLRSASRDLGRTALVRGHLRGGRLVPPGRAPGRDERFFGFAGLGKDGTWRIPHLGPGNHTIRAEAAGRWTAAEVTIAEGQREATLDLHFPPVHEVRGWVMDAAGRPVPWAEVLFDRDRLNEGKAATSSRSDGWSWWWR